MRNPARALVDRTAAADNCRDHNSKIDSIGRDREFDFGRVRMTDTVHRLTISEVRARWRNYRAGWS